MVGPLRGGEEEGDHTQRAFKRHLLVRVGARICPTREDRAALKRKAKELGFTLPVCAYGMGSPVGKSNQMAQVWLAGPARGTGTRPGHRERDRSSCLTPCSCTPLATPAPALAPHRQEKQNKHLQGVCLENTRFY